VIVLCVKKLNAAPKVAPKMSAASIEKFKNTAKEKQTHPNKEFSTPENMNLAN
jgi:ribosomal protein L14E/L6E/L27E